MTVFAGYQLGQLLGYGTFGETYEATKDGQKFAIKLIKEQVMQREIDRQRFKREVRALQKAIGPNVVRFIDSGVANLGNEARYFVVMEYLEGRDLNTAFRAANYAFNEDDLRSILLQIISGLKTVHDENIVHRDLKPANVFLTNAGEIKLLDFGLVRMLDYTSLTTRPGQPMGTPLFMAPEILRGEVVDFRADFYSLGVLIYHLVTKGSFPLTAATPLELFFQIVNNPPAPPTKHNRLLSSDFENLILTLLSKQPYQRTYDHARLEREVKSLPITLPSSQTKAPPPPTTSYPKRCFFRLLHTERTEVENFVKAGGKMDGFVYPANFLPKYQNSLEALKQLGLRYYFDPVTYRLAYSSFSQTQGLVLLPYVPDPANVLTPAVLRTLQAQQQYASRCIDWQIKWECAVLMAPFHFSRDLTSEWVDIDIKLIEESISYAKRAGFKQGVYAGLSLNIEYYTVEANRLALLNRYSRARADGYSFYVDTLDERTTNPIQITAYLELLRLFQRLGKPVIAGRVGTLGLGLLAAGVDGMETGIASLSSFSENNLLVNRTTNYDMNKKYYIPGMMLSLPVKMAEDILSSSQNAGLRCDCPHCQSAPRNLDKAAKPHFLFVRTREIAELQAEVNSGKGLKWFQAHVKSAIASCESVRKQQIVAFQPNYYAHLRVWQQVFV
ncbi:MAG: serine/threonine protein kinase [Pyrinomonadaceae bacterium]